jgi:hypothetical protein
MVSIRDHTGNPHFLRLLMRTDHLCFSVFRSLGSLLFAWILWPFCIIIVQSISPTSELAHSRFFFDIT